MTTTTPEAAASDPVPSTLPEEGLNLRAEVARYERWLIEQALIRTAGNKAQAAKLLGLERTTLSMMLGRMQTSAVKIPPKASPTAVPRGDILRLHAAGKEPKEIFRQLGINKYLVERVIREHERRVSAAQ